MNRPDDVGAHVESFRILFVCTGNTCRSPMAEAIARDVLSQRRWSHVDVASAGTAAGIGALASGGAMRATAKHGLDISAHRSRPLTPELIAWADLVLAMSMHHVQAAVARGGDGRTTMLTAFASGDPEDESAGVPDPYGGPDEQYAGTFDALRTLIDKALARLEPILAP